MSRTVRGSHTSKSHQHFDLSEDVRRIVCSFLNVIPDFIALAWTCKSWHYTCSRVTLESLCAPAPTDTSGQIDPEWDDRDPDVVLRDHVKPRTRRRRRKFHVTVNTKLISSMIGHFSAIRKIDLTQAKISEQSVFRVLIESKLPTLAVLRIPSVSAANAKLFGRLLKQYWSTLGKLAVLSTRGLVMTDSPTEQNNLRSVTLLGCNLTHKFGRALNLARCLAF